MADEQDSGSCERYAREGSSPFFRMIKALADARAFFLMFLSIFQNVKIIHINIKILHLEGGGKIGKIIQNNDDLTWVTRILCENIRKYGRYRCEKIWERD